LLRRKKKLLFYIYAVIVKQNFYKRSTNYYFRDLGFGQTLPTMLFCDNKGAITMALHPANKPASRHIDMRIHFCRQHVELGDVATTFAPTPDMVADYAPIPLEPIVRVLA
jgi:hypothetical protein